jgi:hypothetical protein
MHKLNQSSTPIDIYNIKTDIINYLSSISKDIYLKGNLDLFSGYLPPKVTLGE